MPFAVSNRLLQQVKAVAPSDPSVTLKILTHGKQEQKLLKGYMKATIIDNIPSNKSLTVKQVFNSPDHGKLGYSWMECCFEWMQRKETFVGVIYSFKVVKDCCYRAKYG